MKSSVKIALFLVIAGMLIVFSIGFVFANRAAKEPDFEGYVIEINKEDQTALVIRGISPHEVTKDPDVLFQKSQKGDVSWFKFQVKSSFNKIDVGDHIQIWKKTGPSILNTPTRSYVKKVMIYN